MKKKTYTRPSIKTLVIDDAQLLAASPNYQTIGFRESNDDLEEDEEGYYTAE